MPKLRAREVRRLAWDDLAAKQYWPYVGAFFVLTLITGVAVCFAILAVLIPSVIMFAHEPVDNMSTAEFILHPKTLIVMLLSCAAAVPICYSFGYTTWGQSKLALSAAKRELKFEHCFSGWGHGWKMLWTLLVACTYAQFWFLLFIVPGIIKAYAYMMTPFVQIEHPDWTANQCITESRRLMDGNKWRFFCLCFSFIGWYLLLLAAVFVPIAGNFAQYFLMPYVSTATARFFFEVKREKGGCD